MSHFLTAVLSIVLEINYFKKKKRIKQNLKMYLGRLPSILDHFAFSFIHLVDSLIHIIFVLIYFYDVFQVRTYRAYR